MHFLLNPATNTANRQEDSKDELLTQQNNDTRQNGYQSPRAESGWQNVGLHVAGQDGVFTVTGADSNGQGVGAAHGGKAVVVYFNGKMVNILCQAAESFPEYKNAGRAVCRWGPKHGAQSMKTWIYSKHFMFLATGELGKCLQPPKLSLI